MSPGDVKNILTAFCLVCLVLLCLGSFVSYLNCDDDREEGNPRGR